MADDSVILSKRFDKLNERRLRSHREAHTIVEHSILIVVSELLLSKSNSFVIDGPVLLISGLVSPEDVFVCASLLSVFF